MTVLSLHLSLLLPRMDQDLWMNQVESDVVLLQLSWKKVSVVIEVWVWFGWEAGGEQETKSSQLVEGIGGLNWQ